MAFSRRAKEVKKQSPDNNHTSDFRDLQDGQPDLALRRTAQSVRSLTNGIRGLAKKVEELGREEDTMQLRASIQADIEHYQQIIQQVELMMQILRSRGDIGSIELEKLENTFSKCRSTFSSEQRLAEARQHQYNPVDSEEGHNTYAKRSPMNADTQHGIQNQLQTQQGGYDDADATTIELRGFNEVDRRIVEERNREATTLVQQTKELHEAYRMLGIMAAEQSEQLDTVDEQVQDTTNDIKSGNENLESAIDYQNKARKKYFVICAILVIVAAIIVIPTVVHK